MLIDKIFFYAGQESDIYISGYKLRNEKSVYEFPVDSSENKILEVKLTKKYFECDNMLIKNVYYYL